MFGRMLGTAHCALCDLTHQGVSESRAFKACRAGLPVPFVLVHLDERDAAVRAASEGRTPCVLADVGDELVMLMSPSLLDALGGDATRLQNAIEDAVGRAGLRFAV